MEEYEPPKLELQNEQEMVSEVIKKREDESSKDLWAYFNYARNEWRRDTLRKQRLLKSLLFQTIELQMIIKACGRSKSAIEYVLRREEQIRATLDTI